MQQVGQRKGDDLAGIPGENSLLEALTKKLAAASSSGMKEQQPAKQPCLDENPEMVKIALRHLEEALTFIPDADRAVYDAAKEHDPELILQESNPVLFLRCEKFNIWKAARRLVDYWILRQEIMGPERCFLRFDDFSGNGAVDRKTLDFMETGVGYILPADSCNRPVFMCQCPYTGPKHDEKKGITLEMRLQTIFFHLQILSQDPLSASTGCICVSMIENRFQKVSPAIYQFFSRATEKCFPINLKGLHMVCTPPMPDEKRRAMFTDKILPFMWEMMQSLFKFTRRTIDFVVIEAGQTKEQTQEHVASVLVNKLGLREDVLPKFAGGDWDYQKFKKWKNINTGPSRVDLQSTSPVTCGTDSSSLDLLADTAAGVMKTSGIEASIPSKRMRCE